MHPFLNIAVKAARQAGQIIVRYLDQLDTLVVKQKGPHDLVTLVDQTAEHAIIDIIHQAYPNHGILAEESGEKLGEEYVWVIDPLDGTTNFTRGFPHFAVSIAVKHKGVVEHAVVYDPISQDLYTASKGNGARLNDKRIRVSNCESLEEAIIGIGFPTVGRQRLPHYFKVYESLFASCRDIRRVSAASLELAFVAAGRLDAFWEINLKEWDIAAGSLLIREAGGFVGDFNNTGEYLTNGNIIAGTRKVYGALFEILQENLPLSLRQIV